jgi:hypothetical protein
MIKKSIGYLWRIAVFYILCSIIFVGISFADPGVKITEPVNGATVHPGDELVIKIEATEGFMLSDGEVSVSPKGICETFTTLPVSFTTKVPMEAMGKLHIGVMAFGEPVKFAHAEANLIVQQTAILQSIEINQDEIWVDVDWDGNINPKGKHSGTIITVYGIYSDGVKRILDDDSATTYTSSDPSIISVGNKGKYQVYKVGEASVTISNSGVIKVIPVVYEKPSGIRPSESIPPTTSIDVQPPANTTGWHNKDITITITAQDNEGGSGIREIAYSFPYVSAESNFVQNNKAVIPFSEEGINPLRYGASDNEGNNTGQQSTEIHIDKTPPSLSLCLEPYKIKLPFRRDNCHFFMPFFYKLTYSATDSLSGVKEKRAGLSIPDINGFKTKLIKRGREQIILDEIKKHLLIAGSNPEGILNQLKTYKLFLIDNNQIMYLNQRPRMRTWTITKLDKFLVIKAPAISFKAEAKDNADNVSAKDIKYTKKRIPMPGHIKPLIKGKEFSSEEIEELMEDAVIDQDTLKLIDDNYKVKH